MEYLLILIGFFLVSLFLEYKYKMKLYNSRKERWLIPIIFLVIGSLWDSFAIWRGHWTFGGNGLVGITFGLMPLEEYLFALIIPYFILTLYKVLRREI